jgi:hypothetical protein
MQGPRFNPLYHWKQTNERNEQTNEQTSAIRNYAGPKAHRGKEIINIGKEINKIESAKQNKKRKNSIP